MQRTTWKTCLDGTLATTLSWISKVPDLTKWGKKYDIFLSSLNNSRQPQPSGKEKVIVHVEDIRQQRVWALISRLQLRHFSLMTISFKHYESNEKELLAAGLTFWWEVVQAGTFSGSREATEVGGGWMVGECLDLDGWMVVTSCDRLRVQLPGEIWSKSTLALSACWQVDDGSWGSWSCKQRCSQPASWSCEIGSVSR